MKDFLWRMSSGAASINTPIAVLILGILVISILAGYSLGSHYSGDEVYSNKFLGVRVSSYSSQGEPEFQVFVKDRGGRPLKVIYSLYAWMPNGSFEHLGIYGGFGIVKINYSVIREFARVWRDHLASMGNDPQIILPGILLMGAIHEKSGVYDGLKSVPIRVVDILANKSVAIEVIEDLEGRKPLIEYNGTNTSRSKAPAPRNIGPQDSWPPGSIEAGCNLECYAWILKEVYGYATGMMPVVVTYVNGPAADKVNNVYLKIRYRSTFTVEVNILISASVGRSGVSGEISYQIPGASITLTGDKIWLEYNYSFGNGWDFTPPAVLGIGYRAEFAAARYKLYKGTCDWSQCYYLDETDVEANMTFARPKITNGMMEGMRDVDSYYGNREVAVAFRFYRENWRLSNTIYSQDTLAIDVYRVQNDLGSPLELTLSAAVLPIFCSIIGWGSAICSLRVLIAIASAVGVAMGVKMPGSEYEDAEVNIPLKSEYWYRITMIANYMYSPDTFQYNGGQHRMGSLYVDVYVY